MTQRYRLGYFLSEAIRALDKSLLKDLYLVLFLFDSILIKS